MNIFRGLLYRLCGPTTKHLELELYLLICLELLTVSSLSSLYKDDLFATATDPASTTTTRTTTTTTTTTTTALHWLFCWCSSTNKDFMFVALHTLWLSKYVLFRILCVWDNGSTVGLSPSVRSFLTLFITTHVTGGQWFDRPNPRLVAKQMVGISARDEAHYLSWVPNTWNYPFQWWKVRIWLPLLRLLEHSERFQLQQNKKQQQHPTASQQSVRQSSKQPKQAPPQPTTTTTTTTTNTTTTTTTKPLASSSSSSSVGNSPPLPPISLASRFVAVVYSMETWISKQKVSRYPTLYQSLVYLWSHGPTLQFLLPQVLGVWALATVVVRIRTRMVAGTSSPDAPFTALYNSGFSAHQLSRASEDTQWMTKRYGGYVVENPDEHYGYGGNTNHDDTTTKTWVLLWNLGYDLTLVLLCGSSVMLFGRIFPPIPDQVAGNNVAKDIRRDAQGSGGGSGAGKHGTHDSYWMYPGGGGSAISVTPKQNKNSSLGTSNTTSSLLLGGGGGSGGGSDPSSLAAHAIPPWTERSHAIASVHRLKLCSEVLIWRLLDIWISCGWLPRSDWLARTLGHISSHQQLPHRLAHALYPMGLVQPLRSDHAAAAALLSWEPQIQDPTWLSVAWHAWSLIVVPTLLLGIQMLYLNRTYMSISSYFATEWNLVGPVEQGDVSVSSPAAAASPNQHNNTPSSSSALPAWDGRKTYKKDDLVIHQGFLYQAAHHQPEGRPVEPELRDWQDCTLLHELGPPGTSQLIAAGFAIQLVSTVLMASWWLLSFFYQDRTPDGLFLAVAANLIASYALSSLGTADCDELSRIHNAIMGRATKPTPPMEGGGEPITQWKTFGETTSSYLKLSSVC